MTNKRKNIGGGYGSPLIDTLHKTAKGGDV